ncbi:hypothetical protein SO802_022562 [Lithocarpus litseifolius]|uniref:Pentatricopeptide repeat-containing protein n=1 Tax=Lithocarpus litseifolius TaxID=425828 RepID=A0AAW2C3T7_9ROSI
MSCGDIEAARKVFDVLPQRGIDAWNAMIIAYSRKVYLDEVLNLYHQMILKGVRTDNDNLTFMVALKACTRLLDLKKGEEIWSRAMDCRFELHSLVGSSVLNLHAKARKWDDVASVRKIMKKTRMKKVPGYSVMEVKEKFHAFLMEDKSHYQYESMILLLDKLDHEMRAIGYVPN